MRKRHSRLRERGVAVLLTALFLMFLIPFAGLAIDAAMAMVIRGRLSAAVDSAALAAGRSLVLGNDLPTAQAAGRTAAAQFLAANFPSGYMHTDPTKTTVTTSFTMQTDTNNNPTGLVLITVNSTVFMPTYFMRLLKYDWVPVSATGSATRRSLVMVLVLDRSSSMGSRNTAVGTIPTTLAANASSCEAMVYSSIQFLSNFSPYDYVGAVSFDYTAYNNYPPSMNFKNSGSTGLAKAIANIQCGNNTNSTSGLELAYQKIQNIGFKLANNVIVFFTDGVPNGIPANFPIRRSIDTRLGPAASSPAPPNTPSGNNANCTDSAGTKLCINMPVSCSATGPATVRGTITQVAGFAVASGGRAGLFAPISGDAAASWPTGCATSGTMMTSQSIAYIPDTDVYGNSTYGPKDNWIFQVNQKCAPAGTPITPGNNACKNLGGPWPSYPGQTAGGGTISSNFFTAGPYVGKFRPDLANTIGVASMNSAINEADKIRSDTNYKIQLHAIYLQGNGGDPVDRDFLAIVSNQDVIPPLIYDPTAAPYANPYYKPNQQKGMYLQTASAAQVSQLFQQIASQLLRISQ